MGDSPPTSRVPRGHIARRAHAHRGDRPDREDVVRRVRAADHHFDFDDLFDLDLADDLDRDFLFDRDNTVNRDFYLDLLNDGLARDLDFFDDLDRDFSDDFLGLATGGQGDRPYATHQAALNEPSSTQCFQCSHVYILPWMFTGATRANGMRSPIGDSGWSTQYLD